MGKSVHCPAINYSGIIFTMIEKIKAAHLTESYGGQYEVSRPGGTKKYKTKYKKIGLNTNLIYFL